VAFVIDPQFNGPPGSGHGGYSCGCAAALIHGTCAEVTLRRPPPIGVELEVERDGGGAALVCDGEVVASARPAKLELDGPPPVGLAQARDATTRFAWEHDHPFPTCFGCGPERDPVDALCLFTGPVGDGRFAVPWTPPAWTTDQTSSASTGGHRVVDPVFVWAALDCPSSAPAHGTIAAPVVLGRLTAALDGPVEVGAPHVIQSWLEGIDGRKRLTGVALFTATGERRAAARAVWVELAQPLGA
jgi:hypothetical protein